MSSINYIIAVYAGKRRHYSITPVKLFIDKHVNYIKSCSSNISQVTFIINKSDPAVDNELKEYINLKELDIPVTIIIRPNIDGSYGAWEAGLTHKENTSEYSFLIEDDYIPVRADSINFFENKINDKISYVSSLWREDHSSISNGLFNNKFIKIMIHVTHFFKWNPADRGNSFFSIRFSFISFCVMSHLGLFLFLLMTHVNNILTLLRGEYRSYCISQQRPPLRFCSYH